MHLLWTTPFIAALVLSTQLSSLLTIPYFVGVHKDDFDSELWGVWFRIFTFVLTTVVSLAGGLTVVMGGPRVRYVLVAAVGLALVTVVFNVLFGLRTPQVVVCGEDACMEPQTCYYRGPVAAWEGALFSFVLCTLICSLSVGAAVLLRGISSSASTVRTPDSIDQSQLEVSATHDNSPVKQVKTTFAETEKIGLMDPVFVPANRSGPQSLQRQGRPW